MEEHEQGYAGEVERLIVKRARKHQWGPVDPPCEHGNYLMLYPLSTYHVLDDGAHCVHHVFAVDNVSAN